MNEEQREDFDTKLGLTGVLIPSDDDQYIPAELRGVEAPSWWGKGDKANQNPQNLKHSLGF